MRGLVLSLMVVIFSFLHSHAQSGTCTIQLLAVDRTNHLPLSGANVIYNDQLIGVTNTQGEFLFENAERGKAYTFTIKPEGYESKTEKRWAKDTMNSCVYALEFRKLESLMAQYQDELQQDSPDKLKLDSWLSIILNDLDMESNLTAKTKFLDENAQILKKKDDRYKFNMANRDREIKPIIKDNYDKLTEHRK